ncbi:MAG TPA: hypothetical protein VK178_02185 [Opitutaceae bacterium]|nr:hypothetical protein [Opitutaceae bacterium]
MPHKMLITRKLAPPFRKDSGMTMVETVLSLFIAVFLISAILSSVVFAGREFVAARSYTNATNVLTSEMERMRGFASDSANWGDIKDGVSGVQVGTHSYRVETKVSEVRSGLKEVTVQVSEIAGGARRSCRVAATTVIAAAAKPRRA